MKISEDIKYIGVNDSKISLFEGQYKVENGMAYNSYLISDEKIAVLDTVDAAFGNKWLENLKSALGGKSPDYLVVHHMEPDHSANIANFMNAYPQAKIVASAKSFVMMKQFFGVEYKENGITVFEGDTLDLGRHTLKFITAPMVHWPEVIMSFDSADGVLFSADAFGKFGVTDADEDWACEARRYYFGIVGKYGAQVQAVLKKASVLGIKTICPLHGPVLTENLGYYLNLYNIWSSYEPEEKGVAIAYASVYGNTKKAAELLAEKLNKRGIKTALSDLCRCDIAEAVEDAFRYDRLVLASVTYNAGLFPCMRQFTEDLAERNYQNRTVAFIENGSWAPTAANAAEKVLSGLKNLKFAANKVSIKSALDETSSAQLDALAEELSESI